MEPDIPNRAYCLFRPVPMGDRKGKRLIVWHAGLVDPETGSHYTFKVYTSEKLPVADESWQHTKIVLKAINPKYEPIVLTAKDEGEVRAVAQFVEIVGMPREQT